MATDPYGALAGSDRDAAQALVELFKQYGLETLAPKIIDMIQQGFSSDTIALQLAETKEYKERFKANDARRAAGLPVLSPAEYIATERAYRQALSTAGLPAGFYDSKEDFVAYLSGDVSPAEVQERANMASALAFSVDPAQKDFLSTYYGIGEGEIAAYFLDQKKALPLLQRRAQAIGVGAEAVRQGLVTSQQRAERLASAGVTADQARQGYSFIGENLGTLETLGEIYDEDFSLTDAENDVFGLDAQATTKRKKLASRERAAFSGRSGQGSGSLSTRASGSY